MCAGRGAGQLGGGGGAWMLPPQSLAMCAGTRPSPFNINGLPITCCVGSRRGCTEPCLTMSAVCVCAVCV